MQNMEELIVARVMTECPITRQLIYTGIDVTWEGFEALAHVVHELLCPICGAKHRWSRRDVILQELGGESCRGKF